MTDEQMSAIKRPHWRPSAVSGRTVWGWSYDGWSDLAVPENWSAYVEIKRWAVTNYPLQTRIYWHRLGCSIEVLGPEFPDDDLETAMAWAERATRDFVQTLEWMTFPERYAKWCDLLKGGAA